MGSHWAGTATAPLAVVMCEDWWRLEKWGGEARFYHVHTSNPSCQDSDVRIQLQTSCILIRIFIRTRFSCSVVNAVAPQQGSHHLVSQLGCFVSSCLHMNVGFLSVSSPVEANCSSCLKVWVWEWSLTGPGCISCLRPDRCDTIRCKMMDGGVGNQDKLQRKRQICSKLNKKFKWHILL